MSLAQQMEEHLLIALPLKHREGEWEADVETGRETLLAFLRDKCAGHKVKGVHLDPFPIPDFKVIPFP